MATRKFQPKPTHAIQGEDAAKAYLHPVRMRIMSELVKEQQTVSVVVCMRFGTLLSQRCTGQTV